MRVNAQSDNRLCGMKVNANQGTTRLCTTRLCTYTECQKSVASSQVTLTGGLVLL